MIQAKVRKMERFYFQASFSAYSNSAKEKQRKKKDETNKMSSFFEDLLQ